MYDRVSLYTQNKDGAANEGTVANYTRTPIIAQWKLGSVVTVTNYHDVPVLHKSAKLKNRVSCTLRFIDLYKPKRFKKNV